MTFLRWLYERLIWVGKKMQPLLLLAFRLYYGIALLLAGLDKFQHHGQIIELSQHINNSFAELVVYAVALVEFVGGLCLIVGAATRLAALVVVLTICVVSLPLEVHLYTFDVADTALKQSSFGLLLACSLLFCFGSGGISVDGLIKKWSEKRL